MGPAARHGCPGAVWIGPGRLRAFRRPQDIKEQRQFFTGPLPSALPQVQEDLARTAAELRGRQRAVEELQVWAGIEGGGWPSTIGCVCYWLSDVSPHVAFRRQGGARCCVFQPGLRCTVPCMHVLMRTTWQQRVAPLAPLAKLSILNSQLHALRHRTSLTFTFCTPDATSSQSPHPTHLNSVPQAALAAAAEQRANTAAAADSLRAVLAARDEEVASLSRQKGELAEALRAMQVRGPAGVHTEWAVGSGKHVCRYGCGCIFVSGMGVCMCVCVGWWRCRCGGVRGAGGVGGLERRMVAGVWSGMGMGLPDFQCPHVHHHRRRRF